MKHSPKTYAKILITKAGSNKKELARSFWYTLQKNNQYKDLAKIISELDKEYAEQNNAIFAEIISEHLLSNDEMGEIDDKLKKLFNKNIISKNIVKENFGPGIIVKTEEMEIDFSTIGKIDKLKQKLNN